MKKILKILIISAVLLTTAIVFTTCKQFIDNPEEFLGYWSSEVVPTGFSIDKPTQKIGDVECIPSYWNGTYSDVTLTIKLHNPRKFSLIMPTSTSSAADVQKIINFPGLLTQPTHGSSNGYTLVQTPDKQALQLTYKSGFLKAHEWSNGSIGPEITLTSTDGRKFNKKFSLNLRADTAPYLEYKGVGKSSDNKYVLIFQAKNVDDPLPPPLAHLHGDIKMLHITTEGGSSSDYTVTGINFTAKKIDWESGSPFLANATQLVAGEYEGATPLFPAPTDKWLIYFKTDVEVSPSSALKTYEAWLSDGAGLVSNEVQGSTCIRKIGEIKVLENFPKQGGSGSDADPYRINCVGDGVDLEVWCKTPDVPVKILYYIKKSGDPLVINSEEGQASPIAHLKNIRLPAPTAVGEIITYEVQFNANKTPGFAPNAKIVYYTLTRMVDKVIDGSATLAWKRLKHAIEEAAPGDIITINGEIKATKVGSGPGANWGEIVIDKNLTIQGKNGASLDILNANSGGFGSDAHRIFKVTNGKKLTLKNLTLKGGKASGGLSGVNGGAIFVIGSSRAELSDCVIKACEANNGGAIACSDNSTVSLTNTIINECKATSNGTGGAIFAARATVEMTGCKLYRNTAIGSGGTVYARKSASSPYPKSDVIISGGIIGGTDTNDANKATGPSGKAGGIYIGESCILTLKDGVQVTGNTAPQGGGVYIEAGSARFTIQDTSIVTPSTGGDATIAGKNDVYLDGNSGNLAKITVDGPLTGTAPVARITVEDSQYKEDTQVLTGSAVNTEHGKFTVTPKNGQDWKVDESGKLKKQ
ncbi:right-handed parallel beta-helix repeat-containing protein [Treponema denticola]|uniref:right-handed parallel beta-helix repeat-containing protein n=1 Tax=Treponema denticola TaxID=158 RepID=UPI003D8BFE4D